MLPGRAREASCKKVELENENWENVKGSLDLYFSLLSLSS